MDVSLIADGFKDGLVSAAEKIVNAVKWTGRMISSGFVKLAELIKLVWEKTVPFIKDTASGIFEMIKAHPVIAAIGSGIAGMGLLLAGEKTKNECLSTAARIGACIACIVLGISISQAAT